MKIQDFTDMKAFEEIMAAWAKATGLATVAVGADGEYISDCYNFTDFCINIQEEQKRDLPGYTKMSGGKRGYHCHGLTC